jgi:hypothetical protein
MPVDVFNEMIRFVQELLTSRLDLFTAIGVNLYRSFVLIMIVWFGIKTALSDDGPNLAALAQLVLVISLGFAMVTYYTGGIPGIGMSFVDLLQRQGFYISEQIGQETASEVSGEIARVTLDLAQYPTTLSVQAALLSIVITVVLATMQALIYMVIGFGLVAQAVCLLLGPIFVPFFIVPKLDFLFWGWLRATLQYCFFQVVANAFVFVFGKLLLAFLLATPDDPAAFFAQFPALFPMFLVFIYGILKIPSLTNDIFSGSTSGDSALTRTVTGALGLR